MKRRFNYTGRVKIHSDSVHLQTQAAEGGGTQIQFMITLSDSIIRDSVGAVVWLEAWLDMGRRLKRRDLGPVDAGTWEGVWTLTDVSSDDSLRFRLKVVDPATGKLIASARRLQASNPDELPCKSLLPVKLQELDGIVYKVDFDDELGPILVLNSKIEERIDHGIKAYAQTNPAFVSLVYPAVIREILTRYFLVNREEADQDDSEAPPAKWLHLARGLAAEDPPELGSTAETEPIVAWIDRVSLAFGRRSIGAVDRFAVAAGENNDR